MIAFYAWLRIISEVIDAAFNGKNPRIVYRRYIALLRLNPCSPEEMPSEKDAERVMEKIWVGHIMAGKKIDLAQVRNYFGYYPKILTKTDYDVWNIYCRNIDNMMNDYLYNFYHHPHKSRRFIDLLREIYYSTGINPAWSVIAKHPDRKFQHLLWRIQNLSDQACESRKRLEARQSS